MDDQVPELTCRPTVCRPRVHREEKTEACLWGAHKLSKDKPTDGQSTTAHRLISRVKGRGHRGRDPSLLGN